MDLFNSLAGQYPEIFVEERLRARELRAGGNGLALRAIGATARLFRRLAAMIERWATRPSDAGSSFRTHTLTR